MSNQDDGRELPSEGRVTAPDMAIDEEVWTPDEDETVVRGEPQTVDEIMAAGPQPPISRPEQIERQLADMEGRPSPSIVELRDRARAEQAGRNQQEASAPGKPLDEAEAHAALSLMLSATKPPPPDDDWYKIDRLSRQARAPFWVHMRGLTDGEFERLQQGAYREPTKLEKDQGVTGPVQDRSLLNKMVLVQAIISPKMTDEELITKFGPSPLDVVHKWFSPGEINTLSAYVSDLSGYATGAIQRAKE
jgi:hypothetical protein